MFSVIVLLSTYNGEKFLREQIESLLLQKGVACKILVRDDGSKDSTMDILSEYAKEYNNISFYQGKNCGPAKSFLELIKQAEDADFYAFCDQDDIWDEDKIIIAVETLSRLDSRQPNLYYSNLRIVDENLEYYRMSHVGNYYNSNKFSALTENLCTGCTAVFNRKAKELMSKRLPDYCTMHDTWTYMTCMLLGNVVYDKNAHISYRQHSNNVIGAYLKKSRWNIVKERLARLFKRGLQPRYMNAKNFYECFEDLMDSECKKKILKIINYKRNLKNRMSLFFDKDIKATTKYGNLRFRLHILWGTV